MGALGQSNVAEYLSQQTLPPPQGMPYDPSTFSPYASGYATSQMQYHGHNATESAIDDGDDVFTKSNDSESANNGGQYYADILRRSQWQSSLGFGELSEMPQSRRHSMADMPTRRNSTTVNNGTDTANSRGMAPPIGYAHDNCKSFHLVCIEV